MILETARLILRPFAADDLDRVAELMANKDFMRFSMGQKLAHTSKCPNSAKRFGVRQPAGAF